MAGEKVKGLDHVEDTQAALRWLPSSPCAQQHRAMWESSQHPRFTLIIQTRSRTDPAQQRQVTVDCPAARLQCMPRGLAKPVQSFPHDNPSIQWPWVFASPSKTKVKVPDTQKGGGAVEQNVPFPALRWAMSHHPVSWLNSQRSHETCPR